MKKINKEEVSTQYDLKNQKYDYLVLCWTLSSILLIIINIIVGIAKELDEPSYISWIIYFSIGLMIFIYRLIKRKMARYLVFGIICLIFVLGFIFKIINK